MGGIFVRCLVVLAVVLAMPQESAAQAEDISSPQLRIAWEEFRKLYDARKVEVVDVRSVEAFEAGHVPGARSVPLDEVGERISELRKVGKPLVLYCA